MSDPVFRRNYVGLVDADGEHVSVTGSRLDVNTTFKGGANFDAFGRFRVSNPETLFDSKNIFNDPDLDNSLENQPLFYDNQETAGSGTSTAYVPLESSQKLYVSANTIGTRIRQTKQRFNYQPGKSLMLIMSFVFGAADVGIKRREGWFDDNNGIYLEDDGGTYSIVQRTNTSGSAVNIKISQANWNIDKLDGSGASGITIDWTKTQLFYCDVEWLGVGRVRVGLIIDGEIIIAHEFYNTNFLDVVYQQTPNLPLRSEISNDGNGGAASLVQICSTVISEGAQNPLGLIRYASTAGTHLDANSENTLYALIGIKLKTAYIGEVIDILNIAIQIHTASHKLEWTLIFNPTIAGTFAFTDQPQSAIQVAKGATANTVSGGYAIAGGFVESGGNQTGSAGSTAAEIKSALKLGSAINGVTDTIVLCVRPIASSTNVDVEGSITWRELT
jgi:hypothetical protein